MIDLLENPQLSRDDQIVAIPTLVRSLPTPIRKIIGDLSNTEKTLVGLQLRPAATEGREAIMNEPKATQPPRADAAVDPPRYRLRLYVSGATPRSTRAIANIKAIGERRLHGRYELEVIDAYQQAELARDQQIIVLPTLIKSLPGPVAADGRRPFGRGTGVAGPRPRPRGGEPG